MDLAAALSTTVPDNEKELKRIIRRALRNATRQVQQATRSHITNDPRQSYRAVRSMVYRQLLGGNINILTPRRSGNTGRTKEYFGADRAFILRFLNSGTVERTTKKGYRRGHIEGRNFFADASDKALRQAAETIEQECAAYLASRV